MCIFTELLAPKYPAYVRIVKLSRVDICKLWDPQKFFWGFEMKIPGPHNGDSVPSNWDRAQEHAF